MTRLLAPLLLLSTACILDPAPRSVLGGESIRLESLEMRVPGEPGWTALDVDGRSVRTLRLAHAGPGGGADAVVTLAEHRVAPQEWTPQAFLEKVRPEKAPEAAESKVEPEPTRAYALDPRFGPLAVRGSYRIEPTGPTSRVRPATVQSLTVLPEGDEPRLLKVVAWSVRPESSAEAILDGFALRARDGKSPSLPDVQAGGSGIVDLGVAFGEVRRHRFVAATGRLTASGESLFRRTGGAAGVGLSLYALGGGATESDFSAGGLGLGASQFLGIGRLRLGVGLDLGFLSSGIPRQGTVTQLALGARGYASLDLFRRDSRGLALQLQISASTPNVYLASIGLIASFPSTPGGTGATRAGSAGAGAAPR